MQEWQLFPRELTFFCEPKDWWIPCKVYKDYLYLILLSNQQPYLVHHKYYNEPSQISNFISGQLQMPSKALFSHQGPSPSVEVPALISMEGDQTVTSTAAKVSMHQFFWRATDTPGSTRNINLSPSTFSCNMPNSNINCSQSVYTSVFRKARFTSGTRSINLN